MESKVIVETENSQLVLYKDKLYTVSKDIIEELGIDKATRRFGYINVHERPIIEALVSKLEEKDKRIEELGEQVKAMGVCLVDHTDCQYCKYPTKDHKSEPCISCIDFGNWEFGG